jgi:uncharacterized protein YidB (DUF937 family)
VPRTDASSSTARWQTLGRFRFAEGAPENSREQRIVIAKSITVQKGVNMGILDSIVGRSSVEEAQNLLINATGSNRQSGGGLEHGHSSSKGSDIMNLQEHGKNLHQTPAGSAGSGHKTITDLAKKVGITPDEATSQLAKLLPQVIDKLTPSGKIPQGDLMAQGMDLLKGLMK